jgi:hypothetical protein
MKVALARVKLGSRQQADGTGRLAEAARTVSFR